MHRCVLLQKPVGGGGRLGASLPAPGKPFFKVKPVSFLIFVFYRFRDRGEPRIVIHLGNCISNNLVPGTKEEMASPGLALVRE